MRKWRGFILGKLEKSAFLSLSRKILKIGTILVDFQHRDAARKVVLRGFNLSGGAQ